MKVVVILGLCCFFAGPGSGWHYGVSKGGISTIKHENDIVPRSCAALSTAAGDFLKLFDAVAPHALGDTLGGEYLEHLSTRLLGFDVINEDSEREAFTCRMMLSDTLSELKIKLDNDQFNFNLFRLVYDYLVMTLTLSKEEMPSGPVLDLVELSEATGLTDLDPSGVAWLAGEIFGDLYPIMTVHYEPAPPVESDLCDYVTAAISSFLDNNAHMVAAIGPSVRHFTGVDLSEEDYVVSLLCDVLESAGSGLPATYDVLNNHDVIPTMYVTLYQQLSSAVNKAREAILVAMETGHGEHHDEHSGSFDKSKRVERKMKSETKNAKSKERRGTSSREIEIDEGGIGSEDVYPVHALAGKALQFVDLLQRSGLLTLDIDM